jgi:hypothetical protein
MKKLILLLLFIPLVCFSQSLSLSDLYKINSPISFEKVCKDNGYDFLRKNSKNIEYTLNYKQVVGQYSGMLLDTADTWLIYRMKDYDNQYGYDAIGGEWYVQILTPEDGSLNVYDLILGEVKNQCQFVGRFSNDFIYEGLCYECQSPNFQDGKICFKVEEHPANPDSQIIGFVKR